MLARRGYGPEEVEPVRRLENGEFTPHGIASNLQLWYQRVYDQPPAQKLTRQLANRLLVPSWLPWHGASSPAGITLGRVMAPCDGSNRI